MPQWKNKIQLGDIFHNEDLTFEQRRDAIVRRIANAPWVDHADMDLLAILEELGDAEDADEFDYAWNAFYDWADADHHVWVDTFSS